MRIPLLIAFLLLSLSTAWAQPINDDCAGIIDLGVLPEACPDDIFTNVGATASDIGFSNIPDCFNGGSVNRDVWFSFSLPSDITDITISLQGADDGSNGTIQNPQIALYRGVCAFDNLAYLGLCASGADGSTEVTLDAVGLSPDTEYYIRINDYTASAAPNAGDFRLCIEEFIPDIIMGEEDATTACFGTLYDSGGPDGDYQNNEALTFTIAPGSSFQCLEITLANFQIENNFDFLNFYEGTDISGPLIASFTGSSNGPIQIQTSATAVTVLLDSDGSATEPGFELSWNCSSLPCSGSTFDNPTLISGLPFEESGFTTCEQGASFASSPCITESNFLAGEELVFAYEVADPDQCVTVELTGEDQGTGLIVLDGPANDPASSCLGFGPTGIVNGLEFPEAGTYFIVVANGEGCTDFGLSITPSDCSLTPSLANALCNPLNGCLGLDGLPSVFNFSPGFEDVAITEDQNNGCWGGIGQTGFYWFTVEAQQDGPFGFIVQAAVPEESSDIDFNVWGPLDKDLVCNDQQAAIEFIETTQPIRSSYAGGDDPTGLVDINPVNGLPVTDVYDCESEAPELNDDFVSTIDAQEGEVYVVLVNDWGGDILSGAVSVDWSPSDPAILAPIPPTVVTNDTAICPGQSVQLQVEASVDEITWIADTSTLSCTDCFNPVASPLETTTYQAVVEAVCYTDTIEVTVQVYEVDAGPNLTVCRGEDIQIMAGIDFIDGTYEWTSTDNVTLSCSDCPAPVVTANDSGLASIIVTLFGNGCTVQDAMQLEVLEQNAPEYTVAENQEICVGESVNIGGEVVAATDYNWFSAPPGFSSDAADPSVSPDTTTTYFLEATNNECPLPSLDSVEVRVFTPPVLQVASDTSLCQGDSLTLGITQAQPNVSYSWAGPPEIIDPANANSLAFPQQSGTYTLTATRGACVEEASFEVDITPIAINIIGDDSLRICNGTEVELLVDITPAGDTALWTSTQPGFDSLLSNSLTVSPESQVTYYAQIGVDACFRIDSVVIIVDSLPADLSIAPMDTTVCKGEKVLFTSPLYDPADFPSIDFLWDPSQGQETPDSLYNMVITATEEAEEYLRITTNGACVDTARVQLTVDVPPTLTISPQDTVICPGEAIELLVTLEGEVDEQEWTTGAELLSCPACLNPTTAPITEPTTFTFEASKGDCPSEVAARVSFPPAVSYVLQEDVVICEGESVQLIFNASDEGTYTWTSTDPDFGEVISNDLSVSPDETATYFLTVESECGMTEDSLTVEVIPEPELLSVSISDDVICQGEEVTLAAEVANAQDNDTYLWFNEAGEEIASGATVTVTPAQSGTISLNFASAEGCGSFTGAVSVEVLPAPALALADNAIICLGESIQLNLESDASTTYSWTATDPNFSSSEAEPVVTPAESTTYTVVASNGNCPDVEASVTVEVVQELSLQLIADAELICAGEEITIEALLSGPGAPGSTFEWSGSDGSLFEGSSIQVSPQATTTYTVNYSDELGCNALAGEITTEVEAGIELTGISLEPDTTSFLVGDVVTLTAEYLAPAFEESELLFEWFAGTDPVVPLQSGLGLASVSDTLLAATENQVYSVTITTPAGCSYSTETGILVEGIEVAMPNTFTPNGDGTNDVFTFVSNVPASTIEVVEFMIYNRWGQLVYENGRPDVGWDGTLDGTPQPSEVYFYYIQLRGPAGIELPALQGDVTLLR